jgi:hypothetical protein
MDSDRSDACADTPASNQASGSRICDVSRVRRSTRRSPRSGGVFLSSRGGVSGETANSSGGTAVLERRLKGTLSPVRMICPVRMRGSNSTSRVGLIVPSRGHADGPICHRVCGGCGRHRCVALTVGFAGAAAPSALSGRHKVPTGVPDHRYPGSSIEYPSGSIVPSGAPIRLPDAGAVTDAGNAT